MNIFELVNRLAIMLAARAPEWAAQLLFTGAPKDAAGISLQNSPKTRIVIDVREQVHARTARLYLDTAHLTSTYTITLSGNDAVYDADAAGAADAEDVLEGIAQAITNESGTGMLVTAEALDEDGDDVLDVVRIQGIDEADFALDFAAVGGGVLAATADPASVSARLYLTARGRGTIPAGWRVPAGGDLGEVTWRGYDERVDTAGHGRAYVELYDVTGHADDGAGVSLVPSVWIGPAVGE